MHGAGLANCIFGPSHMIIIEFQLRAHNFGFDSFMKIALATGGHYLMIDATLMNGKRPPKKSPKTSSTSSEMTKDSTNGGGSGSSGGGVHLSNEWIESTLVPSLSNIIRSRFRMSKELIRRMKGRDGRQSQKLVDGKHAETSKNGADGSSNVTFLASAVQLPLPYIPTRTGTPAITRTSVMLAIDIMLGPSTGAR